MVDAPTLSTCLLLAARMRYATLRKFRQAGASCDMYHHCAHTGWLKVVPDKNVVKMNRSPVNALGDSCDMKGGLPTT